MGVVAWHQQALINRQAGLLERSAIARPSSRLLEVTWSRCAGCLVGVVK
jgi:hypothetical protein